MKSTFMLGISIPSSVGGGLSFGGGGGTDSSQQRRRMKTRARIRAMITQAMTPMITPVKPLDSTVGAATSPVPRDDMGGGGNGEGGGGGGGSGGGEDRSHRPSSHRPSARMHEFVQMVCALEIPTIMARKMVRASRGTDPKRPAEPR